MINVFSPLRQKCFLKADSPLHRSQGEHIESSYPVEHGKWRVLDAPQSSFVFEFCKEHFMSSAFPCADERTIRSSGLSARHPYLVPNACLSPKGCCFIGKCCSAIRTALLMRPVHLLQTLKGNSLCGEEFKVYPFFLLNLVDNGRDFPHCQLKMWKAGKNVPGRILKHLVLRPFCSAKVTSKFFPDCTLNSEHQVSLMDSQLLNWLHQLRYSLFLCSSWP